MEAPSSPSSIITAPPDYHESALRLTKLITEAMTCHFALLHYDSPTMTRERNFYRQTLRSTVKNRKVEEGHTQRRQYTHGGIRPPIRLIGIKLPVPSLSVIILLSDNAAEHKELHPIQLEWTFLERTELMKRLESVGDGVTTNHQASYSILFKRSASGVGLDQALARNGSHAGGAAQERGPGH
ncbi:uncharacterized protein F5147DRAFT_654078 [Suillus discolor]|uniref:Uncharacterized protein n=1 Tax=Suillus discolor TaxID=1912936 RepID=A0A9P7F417_9AGAM|nr:uncharacterized protein F5147DRAFT_654078 [Suillus discolor]KAG2105836.1 hypothetical protein F5147DRAFT_654078 [Suillus discolor]